jgi:hypothetical protein
MNLFRKPLGFLRDLLFFLQKRGDPHARRFFMDRFKSIFFRRIEYRVLARSLADLEPAPPNPLGIRIRRAGEKDIDRLKGTIFPSDIGRFRLRLKKGRLFYMAFLDGLPVAYSWATSKLQFGVDNLRLPLEQGDIYFDDAFTFPEWRAKGINSLMNHFLRETFRKQGFSHGVVISAKDNTPSIRVLEKTGWSQVDALSFRRVLFYRKWVYHNEGGGRP